MTGTALAQPPEVTFVAVPASDAYGIGEQLDFTVSFDQDVLVTGTPQLSLAIGATTRYADYIAGSGTHALIFRHTIIEGDFDANGIIVGMLGANGGRITNSLGEDAVLVLNAVSSTANVVVDGVRPQVIAIELAGTPAPEDSEVTYQVTFSERVGSVSASDFIVTATGSATGTVTNVAGADAVYSARVGNIAGTGTLRLDVSASSAIQDIAGNAMTSGYSAGPAHTVDRQAEQTITFANPGAQNFGTTPTLTATASSDYQPTFSSGTPGVCEITPTGTLTFITAGQCTILADQAGDNIYQPAPQVSQSFTVNAIVPGAPGNVAATAGDTQAAVSFTPPANSGGAQIFRYSVTTTPPDIAPVFGATSPIIVTSLTNGQAYTFTVVAENSAGFGAASMASSPITPAPVQTITFANPGTQPFDTSPTLTASSDSDLPVTFNSRTPSVCTITADGTLTFVAPGTCTIDADQPGNANYLPAPQVTNSFTVAAALPGAPTNVSAIAGNQVAVVSFTPPTSTGGLPITSYTVTAAPGGVSETDSASPITVSGLDNGVSYTFTVTAETSAGVGAVSAPSAPAIPGLEQTIAFDNPGAQVIGTSIALTATASSDLPVSFSSTNTAICTVTPQGQLTPIAQGTCVIEASQAGNTTYSPAPIVQQSFDVNTSTVAVMPASGALADAMAGEGYSASFAASGQLGQLVWSLTHGTLPSGLVLNASTGELAGILAANSLGDYAFTVSATDQAGGGTGSASVSLAVVERAVTAQNQTIPVPAGSTPLPVNLVENATGGPFTGASVVSVEPANAGTTRIIMGLVSSITTTYPDSFYLQFTPNPQFSGRAVIGYTLESALGTSSVASITFDIAGDPDAVSALFSDLSRDFVTTRANLLASHIQTPGLRERRGLANATAPGTIDLSPAGNSINMNFASSTLQIAAFESMEGLVAETIDTGGVNFWIDGTATLHVSTGRAGDHWGSFALLSAGADMMVSEDFLAGVALHADWMEDRSNLSAVTGQGLLAGPYISAELADGLFLDASLLYGKSWNQASTDLFNGTFATDRLIARASLEGSVDMGEGLSFRPLGTLFYLREEMGSYTVSDQLGNNALVPGFTTDQLRLGAGGSLHYRLETESGLIVQPYFGVQLGLSLIDGQPGQFTTISGGLDIAGHGDWTIGLSTQADLTQNDFKSLSARARLGLHF